MKLICLKIIIQYFDDTLVDFLKMKKKQKTDYYKIGLANILLLYKILYQKL